MSASETRQSLRPIACSLLGVSRRSVGDLRIFLAAGRGRLAGPVPHTSVYVWPLLSCERATLARNRVRLQLETLQMREHVSSFALAFLGFVCVLVVFVVVLFAIFVTGAALAHGRVRVLFRWTTDMDDSQCTTAT